MPRAFPFALGIGTDICHIPRVKRLLKLPTAQSFLKKVFNPSEMEAYASRLKVLEEYKTTKVPQNEPDGESKQDMNFMKTRLSQLAIFVSGRWAAKEAAIKAHTLRRLTMHDITILEGKLKDGKSTAPIMTINARDGELGKGQVVKISISHDKGYATAVCLVAENAEDGT